MATEVKLTLDGIMLNWLKNVGDTVATGDIIAEIEADKATVEIEAEVDGVLLETRGELGEEMPEGSVIAVIGAAGESAAPVKAAPQEAPAAATPAPQAAPVVAQPVSAPSAAVTSNGRIKISPVARRLADDLGYDVRMIAGSGPEGRITKADVESFVPAAAAPAPQVASPSAAPAAGPAQRATYGAVPEGVDIEIVEISRMRRAIADNTILSKQQVPHFYVTVEMNVESLLALRQELNARLADEGIKISVNDFIVKAAAITLKQFPNLNAHYYGDKIVRHKRINVGIAVSLPNNGLMNVVSHNADKTALSVMAQNHKAMIARVRDGKAKPDDIRGATFTVSNLGIYDVEHFGAIINPPEAAILAVSAARQIPVVNEDGTVGVGTRMKVTISVDHRVSDGAEGAEYMIRLKELIENPMRLLV